MKAPVVHACHVLSFQDQAEGMHVLQHATSLLQYEQRWWGWLGIMPSCYHFLML